MKKLFLILAMMAFMLLFVQADSCAPNITLLNQDPYPAVPGDYVKLVFQIEDISSSECSDITLKLIEDYPLVFDPDESGIRKFSKVDYVKDYNNNILVPYRVRIDENALDGSNPIEVYLQNKGIFTVTKTFNLEVQDTKTAFYVYIEDFDFTANEITLQILNTGDSNVEALMIEIPKQDNIEVKGTNKVIVGDLDSNEYTTATFEARPKEGQIDIIIHYSDEINVRRNIKETIDFDPTYFQNRFSQKTSASGIIFSIFVSVLLILLILGMIYLGYKIIRSFFRKSKPKF
ncbi:MAG: hypothetical protein WC548_03505 [Candidatus Pacearchaeota archaeon]